MKFESCDRDTGEDLRMCGLFDRRMVGSLGGSVGCQT